MFLDNMKDRVVQCENATANNRTIPTEMMKNRHRERLGLWINFAKCMTEAQRIEAALLRNSPST